MPSIAQPLPAQPGAKAPRLALASLSVSMLLSSLGTSIANVGLPTLAQAFGASFQQVQWVVLAYLLAITTLVVSVGRLGDQFGRKRLLLAGIGLFTLASVACGLAPTLGWLIGARAAQGLGAAAMMALTMAFVGQTVPREKNGSAMGLLGSMSAIGTALGPTLGGVLLAGPGWPALFLANAPLGLASLWLAWRYLPDDPQEGQQTATGLDPLGTLLLALTLAAWALAMTLGRGHFGALHAGLLLAAAVGLGLFVWAESRVAAPLIRLSLFRDKALSASLASSALVATVMMGTLVVGPFYLAGALGLGAPLVGLALSVGPLVVALTGVPAGRLSDRWGAGSASRLGLAVMAAGAVLLALLPLSLGVVGYVACIAILTAGYGLFQTANNSAVMANVAAAQRGLVSGLLNLARNLGLVSGAALMGAVFAHASGAGDIGRAPPAALASGMHASFALAAVLLLAALAIAAAGRVPVGSTRAATGKAWR